MDPASVALPRPQQSEPCSLCSAGMTPMVQQRMSVCTYCPLGTFRSAQGAVTTMARCEPCPSGFAAVPVYNLTTWQLWPRNVYPQCQQDATATEAGIDDGAGVVQRHVLPRTPCASEAGWVLNGTHVSSGMNHGRGAILTLSLVAYLEPGESRVSFSLETICQGSCLTTVSVQAVNLSGKAKEPIEWLRFAGSRPRTKYEDYLILASASAADYELRWTFAKGFYGSDREIAADRVLIYEIIVTNTADGGAIECTACRNGTFSLSANATHCRSCPGGTFYAVSAVADGGDGATPCVPCPAGTARGSNASPMAPCEPCLSGTTSGPGAEQCTTTCELNVARGSTGLLAAFDFRPLGNVAWRVDVSPSNRTALAWAYFVQLCNSTGDPPNCAGVSCRGAHSTYLWKSRVMTSVAHAQPMIELVDLGHELRSIDVSMANVTAGTVGDVLFTFVGSATSSLCAMGVHATVRLQCDTRLGVGVPMLVSAQSRDAYCETEILWVSQHACPLCSPADYREVARCAAGGGVL